MTDDMRKELTRLESERKRRQKEKRLKSQVIEKTAANDIQYGLVDDTANKLRKFRYSVLSLVIALQLCLIAQDFDIL